MVALLAMRRAESPDVGRFLDDPDSRLVLEAARAISDLPITGALPRLAAMLVKPGLPEPLLRRSINACYRLGRPEDARALAAFAARPDAPAAERVEVLDLLAGWANPPGLDMITGLWRPLPARSAGPAGEALAARLDAVLTGGPDSLQRAAARASGALGIRAAAPRLSALLGDSRRPGSLRAEALRSLGLLKVDGLAAVARRAVEDSDPAVRTEARRILADVDPKAAVGVLERTLGRGSVAEQQAALVTLAGITVPEANLTLARWLDRLLAREAPPEIQLELLEAAEKRPDPAIQERIARYRKSLPADDPLAAYADCLAGGSARRGARVFLDKTAVSCLRCHQVRRRGQNTGGQAGPDLTDIGSRHDRRYLLESIVAPNRQVAQGFETRILATADGRTVTGIVKSDTGGVLELITPEAQTVRVKKEDIEAEKRGSSAMPEDLIKFLSRRELRDLVEFLSSAKGEASLRGVFSRGRDDEGGHEAAR
jgi:quinoprotein glucose dehydrogenase